MNKTIDGFKMNLWEKHGMRRIYISGNGIPEGSKFYFDLNNNSWDKAPKYQKMVNLSLIEKFMQPEAVAEQVAEQVTEVTETKEIKFETVSAEALREMGNLAGMWEQAEVRNSIRNEQFDGDGDEEWEA